MLFTLKDIVDFCYTRQRNRTVGGEECKRTYNEWGHLIINAAKKNNLHLLEDKKEIVGVCIATEQPAKKVIFVHEIVCIKWGFRRFIRAAFERYPDYKIAGLRNKQPKTYNKHNLWAAATSQ